MRKARDASFQSRQRELQSLHRQFHSALQNIGQMARLTPQSFALGDDLEEEEDAELLFSASTFDISPEQETRLLVREIQQLQDDVRAVEAQLTELCKGHRQAKVAVMMEQITKLDHVLDRQLARAEDLLN
jgi:uncharacterized protein YhaN